jgi:ABC-type uncharacterized transport system permease subunit
MARQPATSRILKNDYPSLLCLMAIGITWLGAIAGGVFGALPKRHGGGMLEVNSTVLLVLIAIAAVATVLLGWLSSRRIADIRRVVSSGREVIGRIDTVWFVKDRGRVEYSYELDGKTYQSGNAIWKNSETLTLRDGDQIDLIVDPENPSRAFLASLYT